MKRELKAETQAEETPAESLVSEGVPMKRELKEHVRCNHGDLLDQFQKVSR